MTHKISNSLKKKRGGGGGGGGIMAVQSTLHECSHNKFNKFNHI